MGWLALSAVFYIAAGSLDGAPWWVRLLLGVVGVACTSQYATTINRPPRGEQ